MAPTATGSKARWAPQVRRVWAGGGPQRAARTGAGAYRGGLPPTACFFYSTIRFTDLYKLVSYANRTFSYLIANIAAYSRQRKRRDFARTYPSVWCTVVQKLSVSLIS